MPASSCSGMPQIVIFFLGKSLFIFVQEFISYCYVSNNPFIVCLCLRSCICSNFYVNNEWYIFSVQVLDLLISAIILHSKASWSIDCIFAYIYGRFYGQHIELWSPYWLYMYQHLTQLEGQPSVHFIPPCCKYTSILFKIVKIHTYVTHFPEPPIMGIFFFQWSDGR